MLDKKDPGLIRTDCARVFCCLSAAGSDAIMQLCNHEAMQLCGGRKNNFHKFLKSP